MSRFILSGFADEISQDLNLQITGLQANGIGHIEVRGVDGRNVSELAPSDAKQVMRRLSDGGIQVSAVGSPIGKTDICEDFLPQVDVLMRLVEVAQILHTRYIRVFSFYNATGIPDEQWLDRAVERLSRLASLAAQADIMLLHENERHIYGETAQRCLELLEGVNRPAFQATYDFSNFVHCGEKNFPYAYELLKPYIRYFHVKDSVYYPNDKGAPDKGYDVNVVSATHRVSGQGDGQIREILTDMWQGGFEGFLSIEPHLVNTPLYSGDGLAKFTAAADAIKAILQDICR